MQHPSYLQFTQFVKAPSIPTEDPLKMKINTNTTTYYKKIYEKYNEKKQKTKSGSGADSPV